MLSKQIFCVRRLKRLSIFLIAIYSMCVSSTMIAAIQGRIDEESMGVLNLQTTIAKKVMVTGVQDINFGQVDDSSTLRETRPLCVYANNLEGAYTVAITSANGQATHNYKLVNTFRSTQFIRYRVAWNKRLGGSDISMDPAGIPLFSTGAAKKFFDCGPPPVMRNAALVVTVPAEELKGAAFGSYTDVLTISISPF